VCLPDAPAFLTCVFATFFFGDFLVVFLVVFLAVAFLVGDFLAAALLAGAFLPPLLVTAPFFGARFFVGIITLPDPRSVRRPYAFGKSAAPGSGGS